MKKEIIVKELLNIFWIFVIGSIIGYLFEMTVVLFQKGYFETRQGLIYGPFIPVYGIGGIIYYITFKIIKTKNKCKVFLISMFLGGTTEFLCSYIQEKVFGTISWDYSNLMFNIAGRTSLLHCTYWGIAGILYITYIEPMLKKLKMSINNKHLKLITIIISIFMIFNITISCMAADRQTERRYKIPPQNELDLFLDTHYSDKYMDKIFTNKINK